MIYWNRFSLFIKQTIMIMKNINYETRKEKSEIIKSRKILKMKIYLENLLLQEK